jgi:hypothetical protein
MKRKLHYSVSGLRLALSLALPMVAVPVALAVSRPVVAQQSAPPSQKSAPQQPAPAAKDSASKDTASKEAASKEGAKDANGAVVDSKMEILRQKIKTDKKYIVSENLDLTDTEAKGFWPLYESYQKDLQKINQRIGDMASTYIAADARGPISDQLSKKLVSDSLEIERAELDAKKAILAKVAKVLPSYKVAKYAQMENKMRALVKYELAVNIPLIE